MPRCPLVAQMVLLLVTVPRAALPCGPGLHVREARAVLDRLAAGDPFWAETARVPFAHAYLALGAVAPDFQWAIPEISFGHEFSLAYGLFDRGDRTGPEQRLFGLGFLSHVTASDPACEQFLAPTVMAAAGIGVVDLNGSEDGPKGEAEMIFESLGDLVLGDWDTLVETVWHFWLAGQEARDRGQRIFDWYCREGAAVLGRSVDCDLAWARFADLLSQAERLSGGMSLEDLQVFASSLIDRPLPDLLDLFLSGFLQQFLGDRFVPSANFDREKERFFRSPFADQDFWSLYEGPLGQLGPSFALERLLLRNEGCPSWIDKPLITGNIQAAMATLPGEFAVVPGLIFDGLEWRDDRGLIVHSLTPTDQGRGLVLWVRLYSAFRIAGDLRMVVKGDRPGDDTVADPVLAETVLPILISPYHLVREPRTEILLPFRADLEGVRGLYAEFYFGGSPLPCFGTSWDRVWRTGAFDFEQPATWNAFGTYGHWPPSLPVVGTDVEDPWVFVKVRVAPGGGGVDRVRVILTDGTGTREVTTGWNGIAVFPRTGMEPVTVTATAPGFAPADPVQANPRKLEAVWAEVFLHGLPVFTTPTGSCVPERRCIPFSISPEPFQNQVASFTVVAEGISPSSVSRDPVEVPPGKSATACLPSDQPDGTHVRLRATPRYRDGSTGKEGISSDLLVDASAPESRPPDLLPSGTCRGEADPPGSWTVSWEIIEPHSPVTAILYRLGEGDWTPLPEEVRTTDGEGRWRVTFSVPGDALSSDRTLRLRAIQCAGLVAESSTTLPDWASLPPCAGPGEETTSDPGPSNDASGPSLPDPEARPDVLDDTEIRNGLEAPEGDDGTSVSAGGPGGCALSGSGHPAPGWMLLPILGGLWSWRRRILRPGTNRATR